MAIAQTLTAFHISLRSLTQLADLLEHLPRLSHLDLRKTKISRPTDPRPILDKEGCMGVLGSRRVAFQSCSYSCSSCVFLSFPLVYFGLGARLGRFEFARVFCPPRELRGSVAHVLLPFSALRVHARAARPPPLLRARRPFRTYARSACRRRGPDWITLILSGTLSCYILLLRVVRVYFTVSVLFYNIVSGFSLFQLRLVMKSLSTQRVENI
ncbi:hypothetical protein K438DRAFT_872261 [Mycena galopus ATCC 62051]|nr:hypothetical protein K438DRAFT_872261 [Mycena galopus ATCC 62051]